MIGQHGSASPGISSEGWVVFPGGELEGKRPKVLCEDCRERLNRWGAGDSHKSGTPVCFQCYRAGLERERALKAAADLNTATDARFQCTLPFEPVNRPRLERLKAERAQERVAAQLGVERFVDKRRQAQIAARHALQQIAVRVRRPELQLGRETGRDELLAAIHAAELQLPDSWLSFVVSG